MADSLTPITVHGAHVLATLVNGVPHVSIRSICEALGIDWASQWHRIQRHPVMSKGVVVTTTPSCGGAQRTVLLPLEMLNGWLFGLNASRVRPELRDRLVQYQAECFDVLAAHFGLTARPSTALVPADSAALQQASRIEALRLFTTAMSIAAQLPPAGGAHRLLVTLPAGADGAAPGKPDVTPLADDVVVGTWKPVA